MADRDRELVDISRVWLASREIIAQMLRELRPDLSEEAILHNAAAVIARLARADPPLLIEESKSE